MLSTRKTSLLPPHKVEHNQIILETKPWLGPSNCPILKILNCYNFGKVPSLRNLHNEIASWMLYRVENILTVLKKVSVDKKNFAYPDTRPEDRHHGQARVFIKPLHWLRSLFRGLSSHYLLLWLSLIVFSKLNFILSNHHDFGSVKNICIMRLRVEVVRPSCRLTTGHGNVWAPGWCGGRGRDQTGATLETTGWGEAGHYGQCPPLALTPHPLPCPYHQLIPAYWLLACCNSL